MTGGLKIAVLPSELDNKGFEKEDDSVPTVSEPQPHVQENKSDPDDTKLY